MLRVVLDTNQLVSSLLIAKGLQRRLVDEWRRRSFLLLLGPEQIEEIEEVLARRKIARKYRISAADRSGLIDLLRAEAVLLPSGEAPGVCRDPDDDRLLGSAVAGGADCLVTGDKDLLSLGEFRGVEIHDARSFLAILASATP
ncbi:MAG: putative toxin-antitoxin system toxin component, PIN family [Thermoanaerobaculia bacterium]